MKSLQPMLQVIPVLGLVLSSQAQAQCGIAGKFMHPTRHEGNRTIHSDSSSLFFTSSMAVNTDGAVTSYHPDDPAGKDGLAINTICNGANVYLNPTAKLDYKKCAQLIAAFRVAKAGGFAPDKFPKVSFYAVATSAGRPCIVPSGEFKGYFVSTTSLLADPAKGVCDPGRYLDSLSIPFTIYPGSSAFTSRGVGKGTVVVSLNPENGVVEYAVVGDRGPAWGLAEGSVFLAKSLRRVDATPRTRKETYAFVVPKVHTLMLPGEKIAAPYTLEKIRTEGAAALKRWGGTERLKDCAAELGPKI